MDCASSGPPDWPAEAGIVAASGNGPCWGGRDAQAGIRIHVQGDRGVYYFPEVIEASCSIRLLRQRRGRQQQLFGSQTIWLA
jgi:hypothetical protein